MEKNKNSYYIEILDFKYDKKNHIVYFQIKNCEKDKDFDCIKIAIKDEEVPVSFGLGKQGVIYPEDTIEKICEVVVGKKIKWESSLDDNVDQIRGAIEKSKSEQDKDIKEASVVDAIEKYNNLDKYHIDDIVNSIEENGID